jgi:hypothetical protein
MSRIVVGIDGSANAQRALEWAVREAAVRRVRPERRLSAPGPKCRNADISGTVITVEYRPPWGTQDLPCYLTRGSGGGRVWERCYPGGWTVGGPGAWRVVAHPGGGQKASPTGVWPLPDQELAVAAPATAPATSPGTSAGAPAAEEAASPGACVITPARRYPACPGPTRYARFRSGTTSLAPSGGAGPRK